MIHSTPIDSAQKRTSVSFVALERSIEADRGSPRSRNESSVWTQVPSGRTTRITGNFNIFEGMKTPLHQRHRKRKVIPMKPLHSELPEVDTAW